MRVRDVMMRTPAYCTPDMNLGAAVEILWNRNCGILPVVDADHKVTGVVTDRDLCVALGTRNRLPGEITIAEVASGEAYCCRVEDDLETALETMANRRVRRLPVVNQDGTLEGILSMDNVVLHAEEGRPQRAAELSGAEIVRALKRIYSPQLPQVVRARAAAN